MKIRHPKTKGVIAIDDAQLEAFKASGWERAGDDVPTDLQLRDRARQLGVDPNADIGDLRDAYEKAFPAVDQPPPEVAAGDSSRITDSAGVKQSDKPKVQNTEKEKHES